MHATNPSYRYILAFLVFSQSLPLHSAQANPILGQIKRLVQETEYHGTEPTTCEDSAIEDLAENIDWLEHYIDTYGSIVAKQPDIWGEARLTKHRDEYERMMYGELSRFKSTINGAITQQDSSFLAQAMALTNAVSANPLQVSTQPPSGAQTVVSRTETNGSGQSITQTSNAQLVAASHENASYGTFGIEDQTKIQLEPVVYLDQMSRYLNHLHELRRVNEGDDTSDAPGYSMNLVRIPISVLPGKLTREGFGAEITVTATPVLSDDLLPTTFRNLVINDVVDQMGLLLVKTVENYDQVSERVEEYRDHEKEVYLKISQFASITSANRHPQDQIQMIRPASFESALDTLRKTPLTTNKETALEVYRTLTAGEDTNTEQAVISLVGLASPSQIRNARYPMAPSAFVGVLWMKNVLEIAEFYRGSYVGRYVRWNGTSDNKFESTQCKDMQEHRVDLLDARRFLRAETTAAYELLSNPEYLPLFNELVQTETGLAKAIHTNRLYNKTYYKKDNVQLLREYFFAKLHGRRPDRGETMRDFVERTRIEASENSQHPDLHVIARNSTEALAWAIIVEAALLNERLNQDVRKLAKAKGAFSLETNRNYNFYLPDTVTTPRHGLEYLQQEFAEATLLFQEYVRVRWPIHVFSIDPKEQDQNIADVSQRKRELQFAMALGFVSGNIGANTLTQFSRRMDTQVETISLNRTIVGFGHGNDTFGWRFYPRVQALNVPGTFGSIRETLMGTSRDHDLKRRQLEVGKRECVAVVLMPSFVPYADFDIRTNWFKLTNPKNSALTMKESVRLSRAVTAMRNSRANCAQCQHLYREGELSRLFRRVDQLDAELPLQTERAQIPYENTLGGFEMFNTGVTDLSPELIGWYGAPGINMSKDYGCGCYQSCKTVQGNCSNKEECEAFASALAKATENQKALNQAIADGDKQVPLPICQGKGTTLFLVGDNFSVHDTKIIAGGVCIPDVQLISRELMRVTIPSCVNTVKLCESGTDNEYVAVYVATPYGVTNHLHVPVHRPESEEQKKLANTIKKEVKEQIAALDIPEKVASVAPINEKDKKISLTATSHNCGGKTVFTLNRKEDANEAIAYVAPYDPRLQGKTLQIEASIRDESEFWTPLAHINYFEFEPSKSFPAFGDQEEIDAFNCDHCDGMPLKSLLEMLSEVLEVQDFRDENNKAKTLNLKIVYYARYEGEGLPTRLENEVDLEITYVGDKSKSKESTEDSIDCEQEKEPGLLNSPIQLEPAELPIQQEIVPKPDDCECVGSKARANESQKNSIFLLPNPQANSAYATQRAQFLEVQEPKELTVMTETADLIERIKRLEKTLQETTLALSNQQASLLNQSQSLRPPTATLQPAVQPIINLRVESPQLSNSSEHRFWSEENYPLVNQMKTKVNENWRNLRDQLPCY